MRVAEEAERLPIADGPVHDGCEPTRLAEKQ